MLSLKTESIKELQTIKDIPFPTGVNFRALLVTGPPGSGKSTMIRKLGGWSEEGYVDLSMNKWWTSQSLSLRPREIHLGFPFHGAKKALAVFEQEWLDAKPPLVMDYERICIPPPKRNFLSVNWRKRYAFEFILPVPEVTFERRKNRGKSGTHHVDQGILLSQVEQQFSVYLEAALYLHEQGLNVYIREDVESEPRRILSREV